jgi:imidazole glycerol-phosphate synthase subunit HisH
LIAIVDYGMGNLRSVTNAFAHLGAAITVTRERRVIAEAQALVLPGVGAFGKCVENLRRFDLFDFLKDEIASGKPYLGICLGLQMLFESSEEAPGVAGMGLVKGQVVRFKGSLKVPHMGWNAVNQSMDRNGRKDRMAPMDRVDDTGRVDRPAGQSAGQSGGSRVFAGIKQGDFFYFVHSYYPEPAEDVAASTTDYDGSFVSSIEKGNLFACQFHPEKSQKVGLSLLQNFVNICA